MGLTHVTVNVKAVGAGRKKFADEFLVDTGAIDALVPASILRRIGVRPQGKDVYELANGAVVEYEYGYAQLEFFGSMTITRVVFGDEGTEPILGCLALESTGIGVDPVTRSLRRTAKRSLKSFRPVA